MFEDVLILKKGGIHIKKKNRGKFTEYCGGKVTQECIAKGKKSKDPKIRKRATFAANARKWKHENGGILKYQNPAMVLPEIVDLQSKKIWNSKPVKKARKLFAAVNDRLNGDREWISGEPTKYGNYGEYPANKGVGAIGLLAGPPSKSASAFKVTDLNGIKKVNIKLGNVDDYWYVGHQTGSANFPKIYKDGLSTNNGLNGTALHLTESYMDDFANGRLIQKHMSHEGADGLVVMKFPKSKFPSGDLDDISIRLMELGESKSFEVPSQYLQFFKRSQW